MFSDVIPLNIGVSTMVPGAYFPGMEDFFVDPGMDSVKSMHLKILFNQYHQTLLESNKQKVWFKDRSVDITDDIIRRFHLGFADTSISKKISRKHGRESEYFRGNMRQLGLYKSTGYPFFHGDILFPLFDKHGAITAAYGRRVTDENRSHKLYHRHWSIGDPVFFNQAAIELNSTIILCKTPLEALTFICAGIENVISTMGIYSFEAEHLAILEKHNIREVTLAFDNSDQGNHVSGLISQCLNASNIQCLRLQLPKNSDVNLFAQRYSNRREAMRYLVETSFPCNQSYENMLRS